MTFAHVELAQEDLPRPPLTAQTHTSCPPMSGILLLLSLSTWSSAVSCYCFQKTLALKTQCSKILPPHHPLCVCVRVLFIHQILESCTQPCSSLSTEGAACSSRQFARLVFRWSGQSLSPEAVPYQWKHVKTQKYTRFHGHWLKFNRASVTAAALF